MYLPDFEATAVSPFKVLRIHRHAYLAAVDACRIGQAREYQVRAVADDTCVPWLGSVFIVRIGCRHFLIPADAVYLPS